MTKLNPLFYMVFLLTSIIMANVAKAETDIPLSVGGVTLGTSIDDYSFTRQENFIEEVIVSDINGFRKGYITFGLCSSPGEIIRIRLKYRDKSVSFFNDLLEQYKARFTSKPRFIGDSFGRVKSWKWSFKTNDGERVTLVLQHNLKDEDQSIGNTVKLSLPDRVIAERNCSNESIPQSQKKAESATTNWDLLLPH